MRTLTFVSLAAALVLYPVAALAQEGRPPLPPPPPTEPVHPEAGHAHLRPPLISVTGRAEVAAKPDLAVLRLGATAQAQTAAAAHERVSTSMAAAIEKIVALGVAEENISTSELTMYPVYSQPQPVPRGGREGQDHEPRIIGYRASNTIRVELSDLGLIGLVVDASVEAGANQFQGLSFELRDDAEIPRRALRRAVQEARAKAETIASALDVQLAGLHEAAEANVGIPMPQMDRMMMGREMMVAADAGTPIQPGQVRVEAVVTLSYRVREAK